MSRHALALQPAHMLSHWGRMDHEHASMTGYWHDNYTNVLYRHPVLAPEGLLPEIGRHPCFDPTKDVALPVFRPSRVFASSPMLGALPLSKKHLLFFR